jgi:hypothetical protein
MMSVLRWSLGGLLLALLLGSLAAPLAGQPNSGAITLHEVKYADLGKAIRALKGKVVVVDFWATY